MFARSLVIGISQSGASPDVVGVVDAARRQGAPTIAITNEPGSALARGRGARDRPRRRARAGGRRDQDLHRRAARRSRCWSAALAPATGAPRGRSPALPRCPRGGARRSRTRRAIAADRRTPATRSCTVLGRGYEYATAREWALKLKELARVVADPYSAADFRHGPLALVEPGYPVLAIATSGAVAADLVGAAARDPRRLRRRPRRRLGPGRTCARSAGARSALPAACPDHLAPIVSIVPAQLFACHLTIARGLDPDAPRHISKVTLTT